MTPVQRLILSAGLLTSTAAALFPPWVDVGRGFDIAPRGLSWVLTPPPSQYAVRLDYGRLAVEWAAIAALTSCIFVFADGGKKEGRLG